MLFFNLFVFFSNTSDGTSSICGVSVAKRNSGGRHVAIKVKG